MVHLKVDFLVKQDKLLNSLKILLENAQITHKNRRLTHTSATGIPVWLMDGLPQLFIFLVAAAVTVPVAKKSSWFRAAVPGSGGHFHAGTDAAAGTSRCRRCRGTRQHMIAATELGLERIF
jgi:hypothetical protein